MKQLPEPYWQSPDGHHRIFHADCMDILPLLEPGGVDAVVTDPPYGLQLGFSNNLNDDSSHLHKGRYDNYADTYEQFIGEVTPRLSAAIALSRRAAVFSGPHINEQKKADAIGGIFVPCATGRTPWGSKQFLPILLYGSPNDSIGQHRPTVFTSTESAAKNGHPCPKPESWMIWVVELASRKADTILDPFAGSCTTAVACIRTGRRSISIEKELRYCEIGKRRCEEAIGVGTLFDPQVIEPATLFE